MISSKAVWGRMNRLQPDRLTDRGPAQIWIGGPGLFTHITREKGHYLIYLLQPENRMLMLPANY